MKAILSFVTLVALVASTVAVVTIPEFSEQAVLDLGLINPQKALTARITNPDGKVHLKTINGDRQYAAFETDLDNASNNDVIGIQIENDDIEHFHVSYLGVLLDKKEGSQPSSLVIVLVFKPIADYDSIQLIIPVFLTPSARVNEEANNLPNFRSWATQNRVGLLTPVLQNAFESSLQSEKIAFDYHWLEKLLNYNIYPTNLYNIQEDGYIPAYATRPLVVPERTKNVLLDIVNRFQA